MIAMQRPVAPISTEEPLEVGEAVLASWSDVYLTGAGVGVQLGQLTVTNRYLRFSSTGGVGSRMLSGLRLPSLVSVVPDIRARRERVALTDITGVAVEKQLRVFHKLRVTLRDGRELVLNFGVHAPTALLDALGVMH